MRNRDNKNCKTRQQRTALHFLVIFHFHAQLITKVIISIITDLVFFIRVYHSISLVYTSVFKMKLIEIYKLASINLYK